MLNYNVQTIACPSKTWHNVNFAQRQHVKSVPQKYQELLEFDQTCFTKFPKYTTQKSQNLALGPKHMQPTCKHSNA